MVIIAPQTKVGDLLDAYPQLEKVLFDLSPAFAKLKNPILRKTVARVASLQQAAVVGGLKVDELVNTLRKAVGQEQVIMDAMEQNIANEKEPAWFASSKIIETYDAQAIINSGESPMTEILAKTHKLKPAEIFELLTPFIPAPIIEILNNKGYKTFTRKKGEAFSTFISK